MCWQLPSACRHGSRSCRCIFDLGELRGYHYHTGVVFAVFVPGVGQAIAQGGRYDDIGADFGRARPATGFSTDLALVTLGRAEVELPSGGIWMPDSTDAASTATGFSCKQILCLMRSLAWATINNRG